MAFAAFAPYIPSLIGAVGSIASGFLGGEGSKKKESKMQKTNRHFVDQLIASLNGQGPYSDLYNFDQKTFNKSFVEPAQAKFRNQIAPQIQQQYIASGQQRGTGLDDQLLRAGVDLDSMLNQYMYQAQQDAMNRKQSALGAVAGAGGGAASQPSTGQNLMSATGGYLASPEFANMVQGLVPKSNTNMPGMPATPPPRKGFSSDWSDWQLGDPRWGS